MYGTTSTAGIVATLAPCAISDLNLNAEAGPVAPAQRGHPAANQYALIRPNVRHYLDRGHRRDLGCLRDFRPDRRHRFHTLHQPRQWRIRRNRQASTCEPDIVVVSWQNGYASIFVPSTFKNCASHAGCAGHAGAVTSFPSVKA